MKFEDHIGAAVGAYALLKAGTLDRVADWVKNLAYHFPQLPDGFAILSRLVMREGVDASVALQALSSAGRVIPEDLNPNSPEGRRILARECTLTAVERGVPLFTEGLKVLSDNIYLHGLGTTNYRRIDHIQRVARSADWTARMTTFYGDHPEEPSIVPRPVESPDPRWWLLRPVR